MIQLLILFAVCFIGSMIQGLTGFGFAIVVMSILPFFIPFKTAAVIIALLAFIMTAQMSYRLRKHIRLNVLIIPLITSIIGTAAGVFALEILPSYYLKPIAGGILVAVSIWLIWFKNIIRINGNLLTGALIGIASGLMGGLCSVSGPPLAAYYYTVLDTKCEYNATTQATFALSGIFTIMLHVYYGNISNEVLINIFPGVIGILSGSFFGAIIFEKLNHDTLGGLIGILTLLMGTVMLIGGFM